MDLEQRKQEIKKQLSGFNFPLLPTQRAKYDELIQELKKIKYEIFIKNTLHK